MSDQGNSHSHQPLVIIADDDPSLRLILHHILVKEKYRVKEASNGNEVLKLCSQYHPQLVILDAVMPELDGFTACRIIKEESPELPVLIITSLDDDSSVEQAYRYGADDYITKPINWSVLKHRVAKSLAPTDFSMSRFDEKIINNQFELHFLPRKSLNNEETTALEAQVIIQKQPLIHFEDIRNTSISTPALVKILKGFFNNFNEINKTGNSDIKLTIPLILNWSQIDKYTESLISASKSCNFDLHQLEIIIGENQINNVSVLQLLKSLNQLPVNLILSSTGLSLNTLCLLENLHCYAIELDMGIINTALIKIQPQLLQQMLAPYHQQQIKLFATNIQKPEDNRLAIELGCTEGAYPGLTSIQPPAIFK